MVDLTPIHFVWSFIIALALLAIGATSGYYFFARKYREVYVQMALPLSVKGKRGIYSVTVTCLAHERKDILKELPFAASTNFMEDGHCGMLISRKLRAQFTIKEVIVGPEPRPTPGAKKGRSFKDLLRTIRRREIPMLQ